MIVVDLKDCRGFKTAPVDSVKACGLLKDFDSKNLLNPKDPPESKTALVNSEDSQTTPPDNLMSFVDERHTFLSPDGS